VINLAIRAEIERRKPGKLAQQVKATLERHCLGHLQCRPVSRRHCSVLAPDAATALVVDLVLPSEEYTVLLIKDQTAL